MDKHRDKLKSFLEELENNEELRSDFQAGRLSVSIGILKEKGFTMDDLKAIAEDNELLSIDEMARIKFWF